MSSVWRNALTNFSSRFSPSGSTRSMHLTAAMICLGSFELIHTLPFIPVAASSGNFEPKRGRRKWLGSRSLWMPCRDSSVQVPFFDVTHCRHIFKLHPVTNPPLSSPKPADLRVCASKHSISGSISLLDKETRAYTRHPTYESRQKIKQRTKLTPP